MLDVHQAVLQSDSMHAVLCLDVYTPFPLSSPVRMRVFMHFSYPSMQPAKHACRCVVTDVQAIEAKWLQATPLEAVPATLQQAVVNKVSADTAYLELLLQGTL